MSEKLEQSRRTFLKTAAVAGAALTADAHLPQVHAAGSDTIQVGLVGCGGRGTGACHDVLRAAENVKIVALGDVFSGQVQGARGTLQGIVKRDKDVKKGNTVEVPDERCYVGLDAYKKVINCPDVNYVILATPPGFRPLHIEETVTAGKNLFTEKPVGTDGPGIRQVLAAYEVAQKKGLKIAAGTQRRHQGGYIETIKRIHDGAIGDPVLLRAYWDQGDLWFRDRSDLNGRPEKPTELAYQLWNWYQFCWICGDHIVEQHVHNLDVANWVMKNEHPVRAWGQGSRIGGRKLRPTGDPKDVGNIFDNFTVEFEYPNGTRMISQCRQIGGCWNSVSEAVHGTKGTSQVNSYRIGKETVVRPGQERPYEQEHTDLIAAIRGGKDLNELKTVAESTMTAILGREASYAGQEVTWDKALGMRRLMDTANLRWDADVPVSPAPVAGRYKVV